MTVRINIPPKWKRAMAILSTAALGLAGLEGLAKINVIGGILATNIVTPITVGVVVSAIAAFVAFMYLTQNM